MTTVSPETVARSVKTLTLKLAKTFQDESVNLRSIGGNYAIDLNGYIHQNSKHGTSCTVVFVGGDDRFAHEKTKREGMPYLTQPQRVALAAIMRNLARLNIRANIECDVESLYNEAVGLFGAYAN